MQRVGEISRTFGKRSVLPPHLNPLPRSGGEEDRVATRFVRRARGGLADFFFSIHRNPRLPRVLIFFWLETPLRTERVIAPSHGRSSLLALFKRERIKVRDFPRLALRGHTRLPEGHRRDSLALRHSRSAECESRPAPGIWRVLDPVAAEIDRRDQNHPTPPRGGPPGSRNPGCIFLLDADAGIYDRRGSDSAGVARECARLGSHFCAVAGRDSFGRGIANLDAFGEAEVLPPHLSPLPRSGGEEDRVATPSMARTPGDLPTFLLSSQGNLSAKQKAVCLGCASLRPEATIAGSPSRSSLLSLLKRERIKVRDFSRVTLRTHTGLPLLASYSCDAAGRDLLEAGRVNLDALSEIELLPPHLSPLPRNGGEEEPVVIRLATRSLFEAAGREWNCATALEGEN